MFSKRIAGPTSYFLEMKGADLEEGVKWRLTCHQSVRPCFAFAQLLLCVRIPRWSQAFCVYAYIPLTFTSAAAKTSQRDIKNLYEQLKDLTTKRG